MSLDVSIKALTVDYLFNRNITHNLGSIAQACGVYYHVWRPDEINIVYAHELIRPLKRGLKKLKEDPEKYKALEPSNGWGTYEGFVVFLEEYLQKCVEFPKGKVRTSR